LAALPAAVLKNGPDRQLDLQFPAPKFFLAHPESFC